MSAPILLRCFSAVVCGLAFFGASSAASPIVDNHDPKWAGDYLALKSAVLHAQRQLAIVDDRTERGQRIPYGHIRLRATWRELLKARADVANQLESKSPAELLRERAVSSLTMSEAVGGVVIFLGDSGKPRKPSWPTQACLFVEVATPENGRALCAEADAIAGVLISALRNLK